MAAKKQWKSKSERASRPCRGGIFPIGLVDGCARRIQYDCRRRDVGFSAAVLVCSQAIALTQRAADHDYDLPLADFAVAAVLAVFAFAAEGSS